MSYILEALKKAEHDREIGQVPRIDSEHEPAAAGLSSRWATLVVLVLLINAGLLLVLFWPDGSTGVMEPVALEPLPASPAADNSTTVSGVADGAGLQPERTDPATLPSSPSGTPSVAPAESEIMRPVVNVPAAPSPRVAVPPSQSVTASVAPPPQQTENLPVWPQVPESVFQKLKGGLRLDVHVYSDDPGDRFVLVNLQKYREGERLQEGPLLDAITADGIVLSLQGQRFLVRAQ
jgi:general secretion pathway protein B